MDDVVEVPGRVTSRMEFRDPPVAPAVEGELADPTVITVTVTSPTTTTIYVHGTDVEVVRDAEGVYHLNVEVDVAGRWVLGWVGSGGGPAVSTEVEFWASSALGPGPITTPAVPVSWRPTVRDVTAIIPTRAGVVGDSGVEYRDSFDADTRPTADQVVGLIAEVMGEVIAAVGDMPARLATPSMPTGGPGSSPAGHCVAMGVASLVELRFFPDMQQGTMSPAAVLWQRHKDCMARMAAVADAMDPTPDDGIGASGLPDWSFPDTVARGLATTHWGGW